MYQKALIKDVLNNRISLPASKIKKKGGSKKNEGNSTNYKIVDMFTSEPKML